MRRLVLIPLLCAVAACEPASARNSKTAETVLERVGAPDFENASTAEFAAIRHKPSGMLCVLPQDGVFDFDVFPASAANAGAHCSTVNETVATGYYAVRFGPPANLDTVFARTLSDTAGRAGAQPWTGAPSAADRSSPEGLPHFRIARFQVPAEQQYLRVALSEADGWYLHQIVSGPLADAEALEARAGDEWRAAMRAFADAPRAAPPSPAAAPETGAAATAP